MITGRESLGVACMLDVALNFHKPTLQKKLRHKHRYEHQDYHSGYVVISEPVEEE